MKNKLVVFLLAIAICFVFTGCNKISGIDITIDCNGVKTEKNLEENDKFVCNLQSQEYIFTIEDIDDEEVTIKASDYGLTPIKDDGSISLNSKEKVFEVQKNGSLTLSTQSTDYNEELTISLK